MTVDTRSSEPRNPVPAVDIIIELRDARIVLIDRRFPPHGMALPGGIIEVGETAEEAALREAREETGLDVEIETLLGVYSDPARDPRRHTLTMVFVSKATGEPEGGDDALHAFAVDIDDLDEYRLVFDHGRIVCDYLRWRREGVRPNPMRRSEPES